MQTLPHTKIPTIVYRTFDGVARHVANLVAQTIREANNAGRPAVLGLPTGSTPIGVYRELIRLHREEGLDLSRCLTFNLDEYFPMVPSSIHSYRRWMKENFFDHVNIPAENIHLPLGDIPRHQVESFCAEYERKIEAAGGIDLQLLGIGRTGHIGFNEPGSDHDTLTRMVSLDPVTRKDAASDFYGEDSVPLQAITMGVGSILKAKHVVMMALGEHKAKVVKRAVEGEITTTVAASFLQEHPRACFVLDAASAASIARPNNRLILSRISWASCAVTSPS